MSRFAADPKWLIYLPPTMSPCETQRPSPGCSSIRPRRSPTTASEGVPQVVCEEKHMGSRAVVVVCRDEDAAARALRRRRRASRHLLHPHGPAVLRRRGAGDASSSTACGAAHRRATCWDELDTDWVCLDCELMPWSAKAQELLRDAVRGGRIARPRGLACDSSRRSTAGAARRRVSSGVAAVRTERAEDVGRVRGRVPPLLLAGRSRSHDLKLAPFHLLATEGRVHVDKDHVWHMDDARRPGRADPSCCSATPIPGRRRHRPRRRASRGSTGGRTDRARRRGHGREAARVHRHAAGGASCSRRVKCRGREYLRIIYGPDYTAPENLERLRPRASAASGRWRSREFALGIEALERFVRREPLRRVHECVFGVLALESEPVDPRL